MNSEYAQARLRRTASFAALIGTSSLSALAVAATAQAQTTSAAPIEEVLVTGSLIRGAPAVGVPVTALSDQDFKESGGLTVADMLKSVPSVSVTPATTIMNGGNLIGRGQATAIHGIATGSGTETLLMINGMRYPIQSVFTCYIDPSIIPELAIDHIDVLADGASATYGSDAVAGVINVILKHGFEGAITQVRFGRSWDIGGPNYQATQLYGTKWNNGSVTLSYEWYHEDNVHGVVRDYYTHNFEPYGFDDKTPIGNAMPGVVSTGALVTIPALAAVGFSANNGTRACANCYSIPTGTGWNYGDSPAHTNPTNPGSAPTITWASLLTDAGVRNLRPAVADADVTPAQQRSAATATFDQDLMYGVSLFAEGFYSNRASIIFYNPGQSPDAQQPLRAQVVPTTNPYYPAGAPAGLRISYDLGPEHNTRVNAGELASRYAFGLNFNTLPFDWHGRLYYSMSHEGNYVHASGMVNLNMVSAALGNTVGAIPANGSVPGQAAFTKPANVPYLNLFCDATVYRCNSQIALDYIGAYRDYDQHINLAETGANLDGPLFAIPGGTVRAALGANYVSNHFFFVEHSNFSTPNTSVPLVLPDPEKTTVWAAYGELNIPIVGEMNKIPLVEAFNVEAAYRYDRYDKFGGVTTPKIAATWKVGYGLSLRGTVGKAFRAPNVSEFSGNSGITIMAVNQGAGASTNTISLNCPAVPGLSTGTTANAGSLNAYLNPACSASAALVNPAGVSQNGGAGGAAAIRSGQTLSPETAKTWDLGFNFAPTGNILAGLNVDMSWYHIKIDNLIAANAGGVNVNDPLGKVCTAPTPGCLYIVRANPNLPITDPVNAEFLALASSVVLNTKSTVPATALSSIQFINDLAVTNIGTRIIEGLDLDTRYDFDLEDWGAWTVGVSGTYRLKDQSQQPGAAAVSALAGNAGGQLRYRGRVGWTASEGAAQGLSITGFVNYIPNSANQTAGANVPPACYWAVGFSAGSCYPGSPYWGPYTVFPSRYPGLYTFDLTIGYQTGTKPANEYLQNINLQFTVNDLFNKAPPFAYNVSGGRGVAAFDRIIGPAQRYVSIALTKAW